MATRVVEWKKPYTWWEAIDIDQNKVISLKLRDENNLIIYDSWDDEIYVDLQLPDWITPTDAFPVWVTTGRAVVADWWDKAGTIICAKTTSGDNIKLLYADDWTLWIDNWTGTFKQIYFKSDVDALITTLTTYINTELAKKQNWVASATAPENPAQWDLWYDTTNDVLKTYDGTNWNECWGGWADIEYVTQAEYTALLPWAESDGKHYFIYTSSWGWGWWQPWPDTLSYYPLTTVSTVSDLSGNSRNLVEAGWVTYWTYAWVNCAYINNTTVRNALYYQNAEVWYWGWGNPITISLWFYCTSFWNETGMVSINNNEWWDDRAIGIVLNNTCRWYIYRWWTNFVYTPTLTSAWTNIVLTIDWVNMSIYKDWVLWETRPCGYSQWTGQTYFWIWPKYPWWYAQDWYYSNVIVEGRARTLQEVADYFDLTKWDYWIS